MKTKEDVRTVRNNEFYKSNSIMGISLIVLVITIIVIIILATIIIVTILSNNLIFESNKARFESDRDNMQSIFTNTVAKVMAQKQATIDIKASALNAVTSGVSKTTGVANYILNNSMYDENKNGKIIFDSKQNTETEYYTGKQLPVYKNDKTTWYVDKEGIITLKVGELIYGTGNIVKDGLNENIVINETVTTNNDSTKATIKLEVRFDDEIEKVTINGNNVDIVKNEEGVYVGQIDVNNNGDYEVIAYAKDGTYNNKIIKVTQINVSVVTATIKAGIVTNGEVPLTITGELKGATVEKIEIYDGANNIYEIEYKENNNKVVEEYKIQDLPFYKEKEYSAHIIANTKTDVYTTNTVKVTNSDTIRTKEDISNLSTAVNGGEDFYRKTIKIANDIDCENMSLRTIGSEVSFEGTFEGNYKIIKNVNISKYKNVSAFFGVVGEKGRVQNIVFDNLKSSYSGSTEIYVGGVAYDNNGTITNVGVMSGTISGGGGQEHVVGAICSYNHNKVINCFNKATVISDGRYSGAQAGGVAGNNQATIQSCYNRGKVIATSSPGNYCAAGGLVGWVNDGCPVRSSYNTEKIVAKGYSNANVGECYGGGLFGVTINLSTISNLFTGPESEVSFWYIRTPGYDFMLDNVADIKSKISSLGSAFTTDDENRNDGYPILKWEKNIICEKEEN